ncbi:DUF3035 domain-containing protein [Rickettsiales bacterium]|nr:DUF3035 domain-containing protein [Rickettsiales bacterium]
MKKIINIIAISAAALVVGCSGEIKDQLGLSRNVPNEFEVVPNAPLSMPPDFALRAPVKKSESSEVANIAYQTKQSLLGYNSKGDERLRKTKSSAEKAFLAKLDLGDADDNVRELLIQDEIEAEKAQEKKEWYNKIREYTGKSDKNADPIVDATKERERIIEQKTAGNEVTGDDAHVAEGSEGGFLNKVFKW